MSEKFASCFTWRSEPDKEASNKEEEEEDSKKTEEEEDSKKTDYKAARLFECNICFDTANDPVVSLCGHLYWFHLFNWIAGRVYLK